MVLKQIHLFKDGDLKAIFNTYNQFEGYAFNYILNKKDLEYAKDFKEVCQHLKIENGLPNDVNWAQWLASNIRQYGYKVFISLEI